MTGYEICKGNLYEFTGDNEMSTIAQDVVTVASALAAAYSYHKRDREDLSELLQEAVIWNDMFTTPGLTNCIGEDDVYCLLSYINHRLSTEGMLTQRYRYISDVSPYIEQEDESGYVDDEGGEEIGLE